MISLFFVDLFAFQSAVTMAWDQAMSRCGTDRSTSADPRGIEPDPATSPNICDPTTAGAGHIATCFPCPATCGHIGFRVGAWTNEKPTVNETSPEVCNDTFPQHSTCGRPIRHHALAAPWNHVMGKAGAVSWAVVLKLWRVVLGSMRSTRTTITTWVHRINMNKLMTIYGRVKVSY